MIPRYQKHSLLILFIFYTVTFSNRGFSQELVSTAGESSFNEAYNMEWSVGGISIISLSEETIILSPGLHQGDGTEILTGLNLEEFAIKVYPNPSTKSIFLEFLPDSDISQKMSYLLVDMKGNAQMKDNITGPTQAIDMSTLGDGMYLLRLFKEDQVFKQIKIIKRN